MTVLDTLALPRVHWIGESSGGLIGLLLAAGPAAAEKGIKGIETGRNYGAVTLSLA